MSPQVTDKMALVMIRRAVSQTPIGRTPGFLSSATRREARNDASPSGSTTEDAKRFAIRASEWQRSSDSFLNDVHMVLHILASVPEGPADPEVRRAVALIREASIHN